MRCADMVGGSAGGKRFARVTTADEMGEFGKSTCILFICYFFPYARTALATLAAYSEPEQTGLGSGVKAGIRERHGEGEPVAFVVVPGRRACVLDSNANVRYTRSGRLI